MRCRDCPAELTVCEYRLCGVCAQREDDEFTKHKRERRTAVDGLCVDCNARIGVEDYLRCQDCLYARTLRYREKYHQRPAFVYAKEFLETHPCTDCGERDTIVLEFDHVRGRKLFGISYLKRMGSLEQMVIEIAKCEVVCANCHKRRTHARGGSQASSRVNAQED